MVKKEFQYKGKSFEELKKLSTEDFMKLITARKRRSLKRGFTESQKKLLKKVEKAEKGAYKKSIKTHCRDMVILPKMVGMNILVHKGKEFMPVMIEKEMVGHVLGEFVLTRKKVEHSAPGVGATRSSASVSVR